MRKKHKNEFLSLEEIKAHPCKRCGRCCANAVCLMGQAFLGESTPAPCPALIKPNMKQNNVHACGIRFMIRDEYHAMFDKRMGIGLGCDSIFNPEYEQKENENG